MKIDRREAFKALSDDATFGTTAHLIAIGTFGDEVYDMDPLELFVNLEEEYKMELSEKVAEKLQAILLATTTDAFFEDPVAFRAIANTLVEGEPGFDGFDNVTIPEVLWAIYEVELNHPGTDFTPGVSRFIDEELQNDGEDIDDLDEAMASTYHQRAVQDLHEELGDQLVAVGIPRGELPPI